MRTVMETGQQVTRTAEEKLIRRPSRNAGMPSRYGSLHVTVVCCTVEYACKLQGPQKRSSYAGQAETQGWGCYMSL